MSEDVTEQNAGNLLTLRSELKEILGHLNITEQTLSTPAVQEVVIARRAVEDARMRLGVALAYVSGKDPLENK